jgi:hypothetical protein
MAYEYYGIDVELLRRRFWPAARSPNAYYHRIRRLVVARYLQSKRIPLVSGLIGGTLFLTIGPAARPVLTRLLRVPAQELRRASRAVNPFEVAHRTGIGHVRLSVELAVEQQAGVILTEWRSDVELEKDPLVSTPVGKPSAEAIVNIPDGAFTIDTAKGALTAYLELDLSTITRPQVLRRRIRGYLLHRRTLSRARPVLFVTTTQKRLTQLASWCVLEAKTLRQNPTLFLLTTRGRLSEHTVLSAPIWQVAGLTAPRALLPPALRASVQADLPSDALTPRTGPTTS